MGTFLVCHGGWTAGWAWKKVRPLLRAGGHEVFTPSYTGLGERAHLVSPTIDVETHISDILGVIEYEGLENITLVGHSYGGMVATGVADRIPNKIGHLVYLDAFVPSDGQSVDDLRGLVAEASVEGWLVPSIPTPPDTSAEDIAWLGPRRRHMPVGCFRQRLRITGAVETVRRSYIHCTKKGPVDAFQQFADRFRDRKDWGFEAIHESHSAQVTAPEEVGRLLLAMAA